MTGLTQADYWNTEAAARWVRTQPVMDALLAAHGETTLAAANLARGDWVLDVGCGCGATTLGAAERTGPNGLAVGVDISGPMLGLARRRAVSAGLLNTRFDTGDVQTHPLGDQRYHAAISRFGIMFFEKPELAFTRIRKALRRGGRFAAVCWRGVEENPWISVPMTATAAFLAMEPIDPSAPGPHSLASRERVTSLVDAAGFSAVRVEPLDLTLTVATTAEDAARLIVQFGQTGRALNGATDDLRRRAVEAVADALTPYCALRSVRMPSGAWLVTACRGG